MDKSGSIYVRAMIRATVKTLTLKPNLVMLLYEYIHKVRICGWYRSMPDIRRSVQQRRTARTAWRRCTRPKRNIIH